MSALATKRAFGGRRACVGDTVVLAASKHDGSPGTCLRAGLVVAVASKDDRPYLFDIRAGTVDWDTPAWAFFIATTEAEVEAMPLGSWTWPSVELREAVMLELDAARVMSRRLTDSAPAE